MTSTVSDEPGEALVPPFEPGCRYRFASKIEATGYPLHDSNGRGQNLFFIEGIFEKIENDELVFIGRPYLDPREDLSELQRACRFYLRYAPDGVKAREDR
jgi:hypothetical protein